MLLVVRASKKQSAVGVVKVQLEAIPPFVSRPQSRFSQAILMIVNIATACRELQLRSVGISRELHAYEGCGHVQWARLPCAKSHACLPNNEMSKTGRSFPDISEAEYIQFSAHA